MLLIKKIMYRSLMIGLATIFCASVSAQSGCNNEYTLNFTDAGNDWTHNAQSGNFTVGSQTFDISIDDSDHIFQSSTESNEGLEIRIDPNDRDDILTITYQLTETANKVSFPIIDLDKKSTGSDQQEQVCVYGYLGTNPIAVMPMIISLDGAVSIDGNCATATTNSTTSGKDESVFVEFNECIDRVVIEYGSGPMAPHNPTSSKIYIGDGTGFSSNVCISCEQTCTSENTLDFTESGIDWTDEAVAGTYTVGTQTYTVNIDDPAGILNTNAKDGPYSTESDEGIKIGIDPNTADDKVTLSYCLSEISNHVYFKIRDLDKKSGNSNQQEKVCVYGLLGDDSSRILPSVTSYEGSVKIATEGAASMQSVCATATTNSAISREEESILVEFDECIDKVIIEYGSGPMAPADPTYSAIYIGEEFGFYTGTCGTVCETCTADAGTLTADGTDICLTTQSDTISATVNGDAVVPSGYEVLYVLTTGSNLTVLQTNINPFFVVDSIAEYKIHTLVYEPGELDLNVTLAGEILDQINAGACASIDVEGAPVAVILCFGLDNDLDDDGISNIDEGNGIDASLDDDGDGIINYQDTDFPNFIDINNDGINDNFDQDKDGIPDIFDLDSDNDGIADIEEAGGGDLDQNNDGIVDVFIDADNDGWTDIYDNDNDNTPELNDGPGTPLANPDTDGDGRPDAVDLDSDNDELPDIAEVGIRDEDGDGTIDNLTDIDGDGFADLVDPDNNIIEGGNDGGLNEDGVIAINFIIDSDGDNVPNYLDLDSDNDGMGDIFEAGGRDADANGITDAADSDNDGLADSIDPDNNAIVGPNDGMGIPLYVIGGVYVGIANQDEDLQADYIDLDSDNDGISDLCEGIGNMADAIVRDVNNDGVIDGTDDDGDGIINGIYDNFNGYGGTLLIAANSDSDFLADYLDIDADNDGIIDITEAQLTATYIEPLAEGTTDQDRDGINDAFDSNPNAYGGFLIMTIDTDGDGTPDYLDLNSDNDTEDDAVEGADFDGDGQPETLFLNADDDGDGLDSGYDNVSAFFDPTNGGSYAITLPDTDDSTDEKDWRSPCLSVQLAVYLEGALINPLNQQYLPEMRADLYKRGLLPGQIPIDLTLDTTAAGQPYYESPWNYDGREGENWDDTNYDQIAAQYGKQVVDWVLVSFRRTPEANSTIGKTAGLLLQDGTVIFPDNCYLSTFDTELYILVEHRHHMGVMTRNPVPVTSGRIAQDFRDNDLTYVGANPEIPNGVGLFKTTNGLFAMYAGDGEQIRDATIAENPSYNITGDDKAVWFNRNGIFAVYQSSDYNMNGDTNGGDKIPWDRHFGKFSAVPR